MILLTGNGQTTGTAELEKTDIPRYVGHFTVMTLEAWVKELEKTFGKYELMQVETIYNPEHGTYALMATHDDKRKEPFRVCAAGCEHGEDGEK